jgi:uncharacterized tellurite resistance protein B-like protein
MNTREEKLSILSELIAFARADDVVKVSEYNFLFDIATQLGIDKETFDELFHKKAEKLVLKPLSDRLVQFHRLLLLMNVDQEQHETELRRLHTIGLRMGLPPSAIDQILIVMHKYPDKIIPPQVLINIFKAHYN